VAQAARDVADKKPPEYCDSPAMVIQIGGDAPVPVVQALPHKETSIPR
jgi:hypothetical protein